MTPSEPPKPGGMPPPIPAAVTPPAPPAGEVIARYYLFQGAIVNEKTKPDAARATARFAIGWETYLCCGDNPYALLDYVKESIEDGERWWQIVDIAARLIVFSSYDPRPRH